MPKGVKISRPTWIAVWTIAILLTVVGGMSPAESWRFDIQLPGTGLASFLMTVGGPFTSIFGAGGGVFLAAVTILTNGLFTLLSLHLF